MKKNDPLQAWDAADTLIENHLLSLEIAPNSRVLVLNDAYGALTVSALKVVPSPLITTYTDSYVSTTAIILNTEKKITPIHSLSGLQGSYDVVLMKLPGQLSYFEDLLCHLSHHLKSTSKIVFGGMIKYISKGHFQCIERIIGQTKTSLAQKKARLIFAEFTKGKTPSPYPTRVTIEGFDHPFSHASLLFSREKLDIGTRFFLQHLPQGNFKQILDLGCGNGLLGIAAKQLHPRADLIFADDSTMALQSASHNYTLFFNDQATFVWTNCFENQPPESVDLVLCNPPFHQKSGVTDHIAHQMFRDARAALRKNGLLRFIGNSHLRYAHELKKKFSSVTKVAQNPKFSIFDAIK